MKTSRIAMSTWRWEKGIEERGRDREREEGREGREGRREGGLDTFQMIWILFSLYVFHHQFRPNWAETTQLTAWLNSQHI